MACAKSWARSEPRRRRVLGRRWWRARGGGRARSGRGAGRGPVGAPPAQAGLAAGTVGGHSARASPSCPRCRPCRPPRRSGDRLQTQDRLGGRLRPRSSEPAPTWRRHGRPLRGRLLGGRVRRCRPTSRSRRVGCLVATSASCPVGAEPRGRGDAEPCALRRGRRAPARRVGWGGAVGRRGGPAPAAARGAQRVCAGRQRRWARASTSSSPTCCFNPGDVGAVPRPAAGLPRRAPDRAARGGAAAGDDPDGVADRRGVRRAPRGGRRCRPRCGPCADHSPPGRRERCRAARGVRSRGSTSRLPAARPGRREETAWRPA